MEIVTNVGTEAFVAKFIQKITQTCIPFPISSDFLDYLKNYDF